MTNEGEPKKHTTGNKRTKQTARKSTGARAPSRKQLAIQPAAQHLVSDNDADLIYAALSQRASEYRQGDGGNLKRKLGEIADEEESRSVAENENGLILRAMRNETTIDQNFEHKWEDLKNLTVEHKKVFDWVADNANVYSMAPDHIRAIIHARHAFA